MITDRETVRLAQRLSQQVHLAGDDLQPGMRMFVVCAHFKSLGGGKLAEEDLNQVVRPVP